MNRIDKRLYIAGLHLLVVVLALLAIYVRQLPPTVTAIPEEGSAESRWWGLWPVTYLPHWIFFCGIAVVAMVIVGAWFYVIGGKRPIAVPLARFYCARFENRIFIWGGNSDTQTARSIVNLLVPGMGYLILLLGFIGAFFAFPIVHTRWGDAYILTKAIAHSDPAIRLTHSWQAPLDLLLHSQIWRYFHEPMGWRDAMPVYRLLSPLAGALYLGAAIAISKQSARLSSTPTGLALALLTSIGVMQLFFGYIENYSFAAAGILIYLWLGLATLQGKRSLWPAALALAVTIALHPSTLVYAPSLLYIGWQVAQKRNNSPAVNVLQIALPLAAVAIATILLMEFGGHGITTLLTTDRPGGGDARWLVPLWATSTRWERYTMVSWPHLRDIVNEQLLVAPVILPTLILIMIGFTIKRFATRGNRLPMFDVSGIGDRHYVLFLAIAATCHQLLTWIWNPDYGGQRDWDLFSLAAIPTTLLMAHLLPRLIPNQRALLAGTIPLLVLQYAQLTTWVYQNTLLWAWP